MRHILLPSVLNLALSFVLTRGRPRRAFNPPVDSAGPLTVRIEGPQVVRETETPLPVRIVLENRGDRPIEGTLELRVIDRWRVEPAAAAPFAVESKGKATREFRVVAGKGTYNAHYPIHAFAKFSHDGKPQTAHPILILETRFPAALRPTPVVASKPAVVTAGSPALPPPFPPKDNTGSRVLGRIEQNGRTYEVRFWPGQRGLLDATVGFQQGNRQLCFRGFEVTVDGSRLDDPRSPATLLEVKEEPRDGGLCIRHRFQNVSGHFDLVAELRIERGALRAKFQLENTPPTQPWRSVHLENVAAGSWNATASAVFAGHGNVVRRPQAMILPASGVQFSTSMVGFDFENSLSLVQGVDVPADSLQVNPSTRHYSLHVPHALDLDVHPRAERLGRREDVARHQRPEGRRRRAKAGRAVRLRPVGRTLRRTASNDSAGRSATA